MTTILTTWCRKVLSQCTLSASVTTKRETQVSKTFLCSVSKTGIKIFSKQLKTKKLEGGRTLADKRIKKIRLSNNETYAILDKGALRLDSSNKLITGNTIVDKLILEGNLFITEIDDVPVSQSIGNVLVQDTTTGEIKKRSTDQLLEDIGGISYNMDDTNGILSLKLGRQPKA